MKRLVILLLLICSACSTTAGNTRISDESARAKIVPGKTCKSEVLEILGKPQAITQEQVTDEEGAHICDLWVYGRTDSRMNPWTFVPGVGAAVALTGNAVDVREQSFGVVFDERGLVKEVKYVDLGEDKTACPEQEEITVPNNKEQTPVEAKQNFGSKNSASQ